MDKVYMVVWWEPHECPETASTHRTYEGALKAKEKLEQEILVNFEAEAKYRHEQGGYPIDHWLNDPSGRAKVAIEMMEVQD